jgi:hypothetical protein
MQAILLGELCVVFDDLTVLTWLGDWEALARSFKIFCRGDAPPFRDEDRLEIMSLITSGCKFCSTREILVFPKSSEVSLDAGVRGSPDPWRASPPSGSDEPFLPFLGGIVFVLSILLLGM